MLNLKFFEFPDIHREHQFKFFHCTLKAHLLPSSFLAKPPENLAGITHKCVCAYMLNLDLSMYHRNDNSQYPIVVQSPP